jgi:1-deoxy-D-xylulose-5-phosphate synthase
MLYQSAFDVGIAEQHAVTLSAGMATQEWWFCNIYSTFTGIRPSDSRRRPTKLTGYFCLDRAGLVGEDGQLIMAFLTWLICDVFPI